MSRIILSLLLALGCSSAPARTTPSSSAAPHSGADESVVQQSSSPMCLPEWARGSALRAQVRSRGARELVLGDETRTQGEWDMEATFRLETRLDDHGALLEQSEFSGWQGESLAPVTFATLYVLHRIPGIQLDAQGAVVAIQGAAQAKSEAEAVFATREGTPAGSLQTWELGSTPEGLRGQAVQWWQLFALLSCADLRQGREVSNDSAWMPGMADVPVEIESSVEPVPCPSGGEGCERRTIDLRPDAARTLAALHEQMVAQGRGPTEAVVGFSIRRQAMGVFDSDGAPLELSLLKETTTLHARPGETRTMTQRDSDTSTYRFEPLRGIADISD